MSFMYTAVAVTAATGIYSSYTGYQAGKVQADNIKSQAKQDRIDAQAQMDADSMEESSVVAAERQKNRRLRAVQEAAYAKSGVLMEGSAADVLTKQRATDEANVQNIHIGRGNQRAQDIHKMDRDYQSSLYLAKTTKSAATTGLITGLLSTAGSVGMGMAAMPSGGGSTKGLTQAFSPPGSSLSPAFSSGLSKTSMKGLKPLNMNPFIK
jgi:hypothetical protein